MSIQRYYRLNAGMITRKLISRGGGTLQVMITLLFISACSQKEIIITSSGDGSLTINGKMHSFDDATDFFRTCKERMKSDMIELKTLSTQHAKGLGSIYSCCAAAEFSEVVVELKDRHDLSSFRYMIPSTADTQYFSSVLPWDDPEGVFVYRDNQVTKSVGDEQRKFLWLHIEQGKVSSAGQRYDVDLLLGVLAADVNHDISLIVLIDPACDLVTTAKVIQTLNKSGLRYLLSLGQL